jgi:hypothetical protein
MQWANMISIATGLGRWLSLRQLAARALVIGGDDGLAALEERACRPGGNEKVRDNRKQIQDPTLAFPGISLLVANAAQRFHARGKNTQTAEVTSRAPLDPSDKTGLPMTILARRLDVQTR